MSEVSRVGRRGTLVIPAQLRKRYGLEEGQEVLVEETSEGLLLRPAITLLVDVYSRERKAALILENAVDREDYERAREEVRKLGVDPDAIPHEKPADQAPT
jgi:AbrB family looped-hinge helix DNA binding protein